LCGGADGEPGTQAHSRAVTANPTDRRVIALGVLMNIQVLLVVIVVGSGSSNPLRNQIRTLATDTAIWTLAIAPWKSCAPDSKRWANGRRRR
jgi:hypothetical protein